MRFFASASGSPLDRKFEAWKWSSAFSQASRCSADFGQPRLSGSSTISAFVSTR